MRHLPTLVAREFREGIRQRWLVFTLTLVLVVISGAAMGLLTITDMVADSKMHSRDLRFWSDVVGVPLDKPGVSLGSTVVLMLQALIFNQLMSMTAVMAGHAGIHDRQTGTLPFLLLSPVGRFELLVGKVLGALSVPLVIYLSVGGLASAFATTFTSTASAASYLPPSGGWVAAFFIGGPVWSLVTGTICVLVSAVARDVRTAQQASWAVVFFATFVLSPLLVGLMAAGLLVQLAIAALGIVLALGALGIGSRVLGRDLTR